MRKADTQIEMMIEDINNIIYTGTVEHIVSGSLESIELANNAVINQYGLIMGIGTERIMSRVLRPFREDTCGIHMYYRMLFAPRKDSKVFVCDLFVNMMMQYYKTFDKAGRAMITKYVMDFYKLVLSKGHIEDIQPYVNEINNISLIFSSLGAKSIILKNVEDTYEVSEALLRLMDTLLKMESDDSYVDMIHSYLLTKKI